MLIFFFFKLIFQQNVTKKVTNELKNVEYRAEHLRGEVKLPVKRPRHDNEIHVPEKQAIEPPFHSDNQNSQCSFRTDIDPKPDIQMLDVYDKLPFENTDGGPWKQGWRVTYDPHEWNSHHKLKVFVVPHSHNDPGWIKTFDEYYDQLTKSILTNMLHQLTENPDMTFIWAEISYFSKWYEDLSLDDKNDVKTYVGIVKELRISIFRMLIMMRLL